MTTHNAAAKHYYENRHKQQPDAVADAMRHFAVRYLFGKAVVVTEDPATVLREAQKQWTRLTSSLQQRRITSLDPNEVLDTTIRIARMQRTRLVAGQPQTASHAGLWITDYLPEQLPATCRTIYLFGLPNDQRRRLKSFMTEAPKQSLLVDYTGLIAPKLANWPLLPKNELEHDVLAAWQQLTDYLRSQHISLSKLRDNVPDHYEQFDNALDTLLEMSSQFLAHAYHFQEALQLAEPFPYHSSQQQKDFALAGQLIKRVSALTPSVYNRYFTNLDESDTFMLEDAARQTASGAVSRVVARHYAAGRKRLAAALELYLFFSQLSPVR